MNDSSYIIKPLDGSPLMSENCWNTILTAMRESAKESGEIRCIEWGSGNSTISLLKTGLELDVKFNLISVDHDTRFFPWLAESIIETFVKHGNNANLNISWRPLEGPFIPLTKVTNVLKMHNQLKSSPMVWQILFGNKRIQYTESENPKFGVSLSILRQSAKLVLIWLGYVSWIFSGILRWLFKNRSSVERYLLGKPTFSSKGLESDKNLFFNHFKKNPIAGCLTIQNSQMLIELWHIPESRTMFWNRGVLFDGAIFQLPDFVEAPLKGKFDIAFIDGRARVPCIKRVYHEKLLKVGGWLFVHDAHRAEMAEAFQLFSPTQTFIEGSNVTLNGSMRCIEQFGYPLIRVGYDKSELQYRIAQELFVYQNRHEPLET